MTGRALALEVGGLRPFACTGDKSSNGDGEAIQQIDAAGFAVLYLRLDNPFMEFIPVAEWVFNPAWMMNGEVFETEVDMFFEFVVEGDRAVGFEVRGLEDQLMMRGRRKN